MKKENRLTQAKTQRPQNHQNTKGSEKKSINKDGGQIIIIPFKKLPSHIIDRYRKPADIYSKREER